MILILQSVSHLLAKIIIFIVNCCVCDDDLYIVLSLLYVDYYVII